MVDNSFVALLLTRFRLIDREGLTVRDAILLDQVVGNPGECGLDICRRLGFTHRSSIASNFPRLIKLGLVEDRRLREKQAVPARYFATAKGLQLWREIYGR